jgi:two-component system LytT family response regulator
MLAEAGAGVPAGPALVLVVPAAQCHCCPMASTSSTSPSGITGTLLRVLVVDDEPLARRRIIALLGEHADIEVIGESEDVAGAAVMVDRTHPNLLFLDVQMPEVDGFALLDRLDPRNRPFIVFTTAHAQHAVRAFDAGAVDYLLKPYDQRRLTKSLDRARAAIAAVQPPVERGAAEALLAQVRALVNSSASAPSASAAASPPYLDRVAVTIGARTIYVPTSAIRWVEADRNYLRLHTSERAYIVRSSVSAFEARLNPAEFVRIHRSAIVRLDCVQELRTIAPGVWRVVLVDGTEIAVSGPYRDRLPRL